MVQARVLGASSKVTYLRARALNRSLLALSLTTKGFVLAYSDMNSFSVMDPSCIISHITKFQVLQ